MIQLITIGETAYIYYNRTWTIHYIVKGALAREDKQWQHNKRGGTGDNAIVARFRPQRRASFLSLEHNEEDMHGFVVPFSSLGDVEGHGRGVVWSSEESRRRRGH